VKRSGPLPFVCSCQEFNVKAPAQYRPLADLSAAVALVAACAAVALLSAFVSVALAG
jgi:hypothetical protein